MLHEPDHLRQDIRGALRAMRRYPVAALVAMLSLGFGLAAATITLTVRDVVFRKAPPLYRDPAQLSRVHVGTPATPLRRAGARVPAPLYATWQTSLEDSADGGVRFAGSTVQVAREVRTGDRTETIPTRAVTPSLFAVLGVDPIIGRTSLTATDARDGLPAVLSYRVWRQLFDGREDVVGRPVWIDRQPYTVIGVMPERFWYQDMNSPIWIPFDLQRLNPLDTLDVIVRRPQGVTSSALDAQLRPGLDTYASQLPMGQRQVVLAVSGIEGTPLGHQMSIALPYALGMSVLLTLLIACANVAVLMIAQWTGREHEIAIRAAIGASRGRIVRALLAESIIIATIGGILGIAVTLALRAVVLRIGGQVAFYDLSVDPSLFLTTAAIAIVAGIAAGLAPALYETRRLHGNPLRAMANADHVRQRWRHALVVVEIAVTVALLVLTSTLLDGYRRAIRAEMGFSTAPLVTARVENTAGINVSQLIDTVRVLPGVERVAASTAIPFAAEGTTVRAAATSHGEGIPAERAAITPSFFATLGVPLRAGRPFSETESANARTVIVNEALARRLFGDGRAIGNAVWLGSTPYDIVGIVADYANHPLHEAHNAPRIFTPLLGSGGSAPIGVSSGASPSVSVGASAEATPTRVTLLIRAPAPAPLVRTLRSALRDAAAGNVVAGVATMEQIVEVMGQEILVGTAPLLPLIAIGVLLTAAGVYGVLAFAVARRGPELAVRVAMGASRRDLVRLVARHTLTLVGVGLSCGLGLMFVLSRIGRANGAAGSAFDPTAMAFAIPAVMIVTLGIGASWLPARRAAAIDPAILLRSS